MATRIPAAPPRVLPIGLIGWCRLQAMRFVEGIGVVRHSGERRSERLLSNSVNGSLR
jgi:hypothetical protein